MNPNALWNACMLSDVAAARKLLESGADPNLPLTIQSITFGLESGVTALMAARTGEMARLLIEYGADVNARDDSGSTPLIRAARFGKLEVLEVLLEKGADATDNTALEIAKKNLQFWRNAVGQQGFKQELVPGHIANYEAIVARLSR